MGARDLWFGALLALTLPAAFVLALPFQVTAPSVPSEPTAMNASFWLVAAVGLVLLSTGFAFLLLWLVRTGRLRWIRRIFLSAIAILLATTLAWPVTWASRTVSDDLAWLAAFLLTAVVVASWARWGGRRTGNALAVAVAAGTAAVLGSVAGPLPLLAPLAALALYDLWAVRRTGHMQRLAAAAQQLRLPMAVDSGPDRPVAGVASGGAPGVPTGMLVGIGDLMLPAAWFVAVATTWGPGPAACAWLGTLVGSALLARALRTRPVQPGLPWLLGGGILGALVARLGGLAL